MAAVTQNSEKALVDLKNVVGTVSTLVAQLLGAIQEPPKTQKSPSDVNALFLAHDAASLIRAHATKLSLLMINTPFTPTAIITVLRELASGPLPSLGTAVEICDAHTYSNTVREELLWRVHTVFKEVGAFIKQIPLDGKVLSADQKNGTGNTTGAGVMASTGMLWQACDDVMGLKNLGIAGIIVKKAEQYRDTLKDAIEELQEWGTEESDEEDGNEFGNANYEADQIVPNAAQDEIDNLFTPPSHIKSDDPDQVRPRLELSLRRLKLIVVMFNAVIKRRFKTLSLLSLSQVSSGTYPTRATAKKSPILGKDIAPVFIINTTMKLLKMVPDLVDNLANAFYQLDTKSIDRGMDECFFSSLAVTETLAQNWSGEDDEFTTWAGAFKKELKK